MKKKSSIEKPVPNSSYIIKKKKTSVKISNLFKQSQFAKTDFHEQVMLITCLFSLSLFLFLPFHPGLWDELFKRETVGT